MSGTETLAKAVLPEDKAHKGSGLGELAFGIHAILEKFKGQPDVVAEPSPTYDAGHQGGDSELTALQQAAVAVDALYASDDTAPMHWQEKSQLKKGLRGQVRRLVKDLDLEGWAGRCPSPSSTTPSSSTTASRDACHEGRQDRRRCSPPAPCQNARRLAFSAIDTRFARQRLANWRRLEMRREGDGG